MKKLSALSALLALLFYPATVSGQQQSHPPYKPELIEFMIFTQIRHAKLWLAGNAGNWELADYEIDELKLKEVLENAAKHVPDYKGMPVGKMIESVRWRRSKMLRRRSRQRTAPGLQSHMTN